VLYLDASALVKHYVSEIGTGAIEEKLLEEEKAARPIFTSVLTFAEIHAALARRMKDKSLAARAFIRARKKFDEDWAFGLSPIELGANVLVSIPAVVKSFPLKASDAVHLASALWLRDTSELTGRWGSKGAKIIFATSDRQLAQAAEQNRLEIFDPRTTE
jgi:predicted nucleic acid-binding protein